jgi:glycosyltransferase involved in cell wall biosynthesis
LRIGGGSRLKILEALATEVPVVTTSIGVEGLRLEHNEHCTVADGNESFALAVLEAIARPKDAQARAKQGREKVLAEYNWDVLANKLDQVWRDTVEANAFLKRELVTV